MKVYIRQIRPMFYSPGCQGFSDTYYPADDWHNESKEQELRDKYEESFRKQDPWASLKFEERYVYIGDSILLQMDDQNKERG